MVYEGDMVLIKMLSISVNISTVKRGISMNWRQMALTVMACVLVSLLVGCESGSMSRKYDTRDHVRFSRTISPLGQLSSDAGSTAREEWTFRGDGQVTRMTQSRTGHVRRESAKLDEPAIQELFRTLETDGVMRLQGEGVYNDRPDRIGIIAPAAQIDARIGNRQKVVHFVDQQWPEPAKKIVQRIEDASRQAQPKLQWTLASGDKFEPYVD